MLPFLASILSWPYLFSRSLLLAPLFRVGSSTLVGITALDSYTNEKRILLGVDCFNMVHIVHITLGNSLVHLPLTYSRILFKDSTQPFTWRLYKIDQYNLIYNSSQNSTNSCPLNCFPLSVINSLASSNKQIMSFRTDFFISLSYILVNSSSFINLKKQSVATIKKILQVVNYKRGPTMSIPHLKNGQAANTLLKISSPDMSDCCMFLALITSFGVYSTIV